MTGSSLRTTAGSRSRPRAGRSRTPPPSAAGRPPAGGFYDGSELENNGGQPLSTAGWTLSDTDGESRWAIPEQTLAAGELLLILAPGAEVSGVSGTDFALSDGETLTVLTPSGAVSDLVTWDGVKADRSLIRENGDWVDTAYSTPGFPNDRQGYENFCRTLSCTSPPSGTASRWS